MSDADQEALMRFKNVHTFGWNEKEEEFLTFLSRFKNEADEAFKVLSFDCRACILQALQSYCQTHVGAYPLPKFRVVAHAAKTGTISLVIPDTKTTVEFYRVAVIDVIPSIDMRMEARFG